MASSLNMMKAGVATENGLDIREVARPRTLPHQVLVRVHAAGMNRADLNAARGAGVSTADAFGKPIGMEWAGDIVEVGTEVRDFRSGDLVMCSGSGGYAEYAVADAGRTIRLPGNRLRIEQAAVLPLALLTAHDAVVTNGRLSAGDAILIQGASSAVGLMSSQIAELLNAGIVIGTSGSPEHRSRLADFGVDVALDSRDEAWPQQVLDATGGRGVNVIVDMVSGDTVNGSMRSAAVRARMVNVGRLGGVKDEFDFDLHAAKRLEYRGVTFRTRTIEEVRDIVKRAVTDLLGFVSDGRLGLPIDRSYKLDDAQTAHEHMRANLHFGKIVLTP
jgi:NADPH2:quinone reductase